MMVNDGQCSLTGDISIVAYPVPTVGEIEGELPQMTWKSEACEPRELEVQLAQLPNLPIPPQKKVS